MKIITTPSFKEINVPRKQYEKEIFARHIHKIRKIKDLNTYENYINQTFKDITRLTIRHINNI